MSHLIFVRHSTPKKKPGIEASKWKLSEEGIELAHLLAKQLEYLEPDIIFSSPENKAWATGEIIAKHFMLPHRSEVDIREHELGDNKFLSASEFDVAVKKLFKYPKRIVFGIETADQALERFVQAVDKIKTQNPRKNIILVTHGRILSLYVSKITGIEPYTFWKKLSMPAFVIFKLPECTLGQVVNKVEIEF